MLDGSLFTPPCNVSLCSGAPTIHGLPLYCNDLVGGHNRPPAVMACLDSYAG
jgi:hypothetical protein